MPSIAALIAKPIATRPAGPSCVIEYPTSRATPITKTSTPSLFSQLVPTTTSHVSAGTCADDAAVTVAARGTAAGAAAAGSTTRSGTGVIGPRLTAGGAAGRGAAGFTGSATGTLGGGIRVTAAGAVPAGAAANAGAGPNVSSRASRISTRCLRRLYAAQSPMSNATRIIVNIRPSCVKTGRRAGHTDTPVRSAASWRSRRRSTLPVPSVGMASR